MIAKKLSIVLLGAIFSSALSMPTVWGSTLAGGEGDCDDKNPGNGAVALRGTAAIFYPDVIANSSTAKILVRLERSGMVKFFRADRMDWLLPSATEKGHLLGVCQALEDQELVDAILTAFDLAGTKTELVVTKNSISDAELTGVNSNPLFGEDDDSAGSMTDVVIYAK